MLLVEDSVEFKGIVTSTLSRLKIKKLLSEHSSVDHVCMVRYTYAVFFTHSFLLLYIRKAIIMISILRSTREYSMDDEVD